MEGTSAVKEHSSKPVLVELKIEFVVELLLFLYPYGAEQMNLPHNFWLGLSCWIVATAIAIRMFWIFPRWVPQRTVLEKSLITAILVVGFSVMLHKPVLRAYRSRNESVIAQSQAPLVPSTIASQQPTRPSLKTTESIQMPKRTEAQVKSKSISRASIPQDGNDNTTYGNVTPPTGGSRNTFIGPTDANGNTIIPPGTAVGFHAHADSSSVAIGSGAGSRIPPKQQECQTGSICNQDSQVAAPQIIHNNFGPPEAKITYQLFTRQINNDYQCMVTIANDIELTNNIAFTLTFDAGVESADGIKIDGMADPITITQLLTGVDSKYPSNMFSFSIVAPSSLPSKSKIIVVVHSKQPIKLIGTKRGSA
jgi:hypothetical protein